MRMNCLLERQMYSGINDFVEQISYFAARDIKESTKNDGCITFDGDILDLIETFCNCKHVHQDILKEIETETERELWEIQCYCKPIKVVTGKIFFEKISSC